MQRVVATRMFKPEGIQGYEWKMGTKQSWTAWFKASSNKKTYNAESAIMTLELVDGGRTMGWYNMGGMFTSLGAIVIGGLVLVIIIGSVVISCIFCKCCKACIKCGCFAGCMEKCKKKKVDNEEEVEMEGNPEVEGAVVEDDLEQEDFSYAPKAPSGRAGRANRAPTLNR